MLLDATLLPGGDMPADTSASAYPVVPQLFEVQITDLYGNVLTWTDDLGIQHTTVEQYSNLSVSMEVSQDRTASFTLSLYNPAVALLSFTSEGSYKIGALGRMARIRYRGETIFWGLIVNPKYSTQNGTVTVECQGPTFKLRHRHLNLGDDLVGANEGSAPHVPSDHTTMKQIVEAAYDTPSQYAENIPDIGVVFENVSGEEAPDAFWTQLMRGDGNWDKFTEVAESAYGGEFDVVPYDPAHDELPFDTTLVPVED